MILNRFIFRTLLFIAAVSCNQKQIKPPFCVENQFAFDRHKWFLYAHIDSGFIPSEDKLLSQYYSCLSMRKSMMCDIVNNVLHKGDAKKEVIFQLGEGCKTRSFGTHRILNANNLMVGITYENNVLVYTCGYNASGACYLIISFDNDIVNQFYYVEAI